MSTSRFVRTAGEIAVSGRVGRSGCRVIAAAAFAPWFAFVLPAPAFGAQPQPDTRAMEPQVSELLTRLRGEAAAPRATPQAWLVFGEALQAHGLVREAAECYRAAARLLPTDDPASLAARYLLAHAIRGTSPGDAAAALRDALGTHPGYAPAEVLLGEVLTELGDSAGAVAAFERALVLEPDSALALLRLGGIRLSRGDPERAVPLLERALALEPGAGAARSALSQALHAVGESQRAREVLRGAPPGAAGLPGIEDPIHFRMTERDVSSPKLLKRARAAREAGRLAEAEGWFRDLARIRPRDPDVLAEFGAVLDQRGRPAEAESLYRDALALDASQAVARLGLGVARAREGDLAGAEFQFRAALDSRPEDPRSHTALGEVLLRQRRFGSALALLERGSELDPEDGRARVLFAVALAELERYEEAWRAVHEARRLGVEPPETFVAALREKYPDPGR